MSKATTIIPKRIDPQLEVLSKRIDDLYGALLMAVLNNPLRKIPKQ